VKLTFYGKAGCHLCEEAYAEVRAVQDETWFELEIHDVSLDPRLNREYGARVPVLAADGQDVLELGFDAASVRAVLGRVGP
jgi:hypothetical protein